MSRDLTPEELEMLKKRIELKYERFLRERLREMRAQARREEVKARLKIIKGGKELDEPSEKG